MDAQVAEEPKKVLDHAFVKKTNDDAKAALADVKKRRKWGDSISGSPVTTNMLCAEIARMHNALVEIVQATQSSEPAEAAASRASAIAMAALGH